MLVCLRDFQNFQLPRYAIRSLNNANSKVQVVPICIQLQEERGLHLSWAKWPSRAVFLVNSAPQRWQTDFCDVPDFSRWCLRRLLNVENWRPLQPCSQH